MHQLIRNIMYSQLSAQIAEKRISRLKISNVYGGACPQGLPAPHLYRWLFYSDHLSNMF